MIPIFPSPKYGPAEWALYEDGSVHITDPNGQRIVLNWTDFERIRNEMGVPVTDGELAGKGLGR